MKLSDSNVVMLLTPRAGSEGAAIAVVRVAGPAVAGFLSRAFSGKPKAGRCVHGNLLDGQTIIDDVVVVMGDGGGWADINLHGGAWVIESTLNLARREEFHVLDSALSIPDLVLDGEDELDREVAAWLPLARTEAGVRMLLEQPMIWREVRKTGFGNAGEILADCTLWRLLNPAEIAIVGEPNVGKSTLANRLFGRQRSITADVPGTTRDWVGEMADIGGMPAILIDTPGLRETEDAIESAAIEAARQRIRGAELVVRVLDATKGNGLVERAENEVVVANKIDLVDRNIAGAIGISAKTGRGVEGLCDEIRRRLRVKRVGEKRVLWWTERQRAELKLEIRNSKFESNSKFE